MIKLWFQFFVFVFLCCAFDTQWALAVDSAAYKSAVGGAGSDSPVAGVGSNSAAAGGVGSTSAAVGGVGILLSLDKPSSFVVQYVLPGMPAANANVQVGDVLLEVDGVSVDKAKTVEEIVDKIRGATGSSVKLKIQSAGKMREVLLVRGAIPAVKPEAADMDFGREVAVYFYLQQDLIPDDEPGKYVFMGDHSVGEFLRNQLIRSSRR